jgi:oligopeptide transport system permease protein
VIAALEAHYGLDQPWATQFGSYLGGVLRGDLGPSFQYPGRQVSALIAEALPLTLALGGIALVLALLLSLPLALLGSRRGLALPLSLLAQLLLVVPKFVWAPLLILLFAVSWRWLPAGGWDGGPAAAVLPVLTLSAPQLGVLLSALMQGLREADASEALLAARARGLPQRVLLWRHSLPLALPLAAACLPTVAIALFTGSAIVEQVYGIPGLGRLLVQAAINRDYTLVLGCVLVVSLLVALINLGCELIQRWLDPR